MGSYGAGLYQSDDSCDLKNSIALLSKTPMDGDRILSILLDQYGDNNDLKDDGVPSFWMVLADQFSKKGIESKIVFKRAIEAMDLGWDLEDQ